MGVNNLEDEETVALHEGVLMQPALETGVPVTDQRSNHHAGVPGRQAEIDELICAPVVLPMPLTVSVSAVVGRFMTHSPLSRIMAKL